MQGEAVPAEGVGHGDDEVGVGVDGEPVVRLDRRAAEAGQVDRDDRAAGGQPVDDLDPGDGGAAETVDQQLRLTRAGAVAPGRAQDPHRAAADLEVVVDDVRPRACRAGVLMSTSCRPRGPPRRRFHPAAR